MARSSTPSLPGVSFAAPATRSPRFPRLDVAGFVGYAERGPTDLAVAIEDPHQFRAVFGGEHVLARDERALPVSAHLPAAVRAFFANGGRRCHVVRVAGPGAVRAVFAVPGMVAVSPGGDPALATVGAASVGGWANGVRVSSRLDALPLPARAMASGPTHLTWRDGAAARALEPGDLLRLRRADGSTWLAAVTGVAPAPWPGPARDLRIDVGAAWVVGVAAGGVAGAPRRVGRLGSTRVEPVGAASGLADTAAGCELVVELDPGAADLREGDLLVLDPAVPASGERSLLVGVRGVRPPAPLAGPSGRRLSIDGGAPVVPLAERLPTVAIGGFMRAERLRFELAVHAEAVGDVLLTDLAFGPGGSRSWLDAVLPESAVLPASATARPAPAAIRAAFEAYRDRRRPRDQRVPPLDRVTLSALLAPEPAVAGTAYLPVAIAAFRAADPASARGPIRPGDDDLAIHDAGPFLDASLAEVPPARLLAEALELATIDERRLDGIHALALVDEVAMIAVPDAAHRPWFPGRAVIPVPASPAVPPPPPGPCPGGEAFESCDRPPTLDAVVPASGLASVETPIVITGSGFLPGPVEVLVDGQPAGSVAVLRDDVITCTVPGAASSPPHRSAGAADVEVRNPDGGAVLRDAFVYVPDPIDPSLPELVADHPDRAGLATLLPVQAALVRLCHGRGDAIAILDLPAAHRVPEAVAWETDLRRDLGLPPTAGPGDVDLPVDLSFAVAYHPWLLADAPGREAVPRPVPPSGAVAGMIAAREIDRGAWIAPANDPLRAVRGLDPDLTRDEWASLFAAHVNLVRREAEDFRPMSAHTLSDVAHLRQVSVRRLLILLRKAALEAGMDYVFESNHERFRDGVSVMLRTLLRRMHEAGAFAGATPEQSFRIETGAAVNPPTSIEQGRFVALVQVAPSQPAEFLTVEVTRTGHGVLQLSGA